MKKFMGNARRSSYSSVNSYTRECGSWRLMHFDRIHWLRSDENDVMNVHLFGSTSCGPFHLRASLPKLLHYRERDVLAEHLRSSPVMILLNTHRELLGFELQDN